MKPVKNLIEHAWESLTEGWRELLTRSSGALQVPLDRLSDDLRPVFAAGLVHAAPELVRYMNFNCRRYGLDLRVFATSDSATPP